MLTAGNDRVDYLIMTILIPLLEQDRFIYQQFHTPKFTKLLFDLPLFSCKNLARMCSTCTPLAYLGPLNRAAVNPRDIVPNALWQMDIIHYTPFGNLKYIHVIVDTHFTLIYAMSQAGEQVFQAIKALKADILVMGVPWTLKTDNGPTYDSQSFRKLLQSWGIEHSTGIPYNPQGQALKERGISSLKEDLTKVSKENKRNPHQADPL